MIKYFLVLIVSILPFMAFAQTPPCVDMSGHFKAFNNSNKMTLVQKDCESLEIQDPRGPFLHLILDGVRRGVQDDQGVVTFTAARFVSSDTINVDWETFYSGSTTALKLLRRLSYYEMTTKTFFVDRFIMVKPNGSESVIFEENWVKE